MKLFNPILMQYAEFYVTTYLDANSLSFVEANDNLFLDYLTM